MHMRILALAALLALATPAAVATAQAPAPSQPDWSVSLAAKVWVASGWSNWNVKSAGVDPLTDLRWRGVDTVIGDVSGDLVWRRLVWSVSVGGSSVDEGVAIQEEFAQSNRQRRFSVARSPVDEGYVLYVNNDLGFRALEWRQPLFGTMPAPAGGGGLLDVFLGYQFWREEYVAFGLTGNLFLPNGTVVNQGEPSNVKIATNEYTRHSIRLGARTQVPIVGGLSVKVLAAISPYTHTDYEDTHHLNTGLKQPSITTANGGFGVQADIGLNYVIWHGFSAEAGFRYWRFDSGAGEVVTTTTGGLETKSHVNEMVSERYGPYFGLAWKF